MESARLQLCPDFPDLIARARLSQRAFARRAVVSFSTIMGLVHLEIHPGRRRMTLPAIFTCPACAAPTC
ncbi:MAG: hypothetical protein ACUVS4_15605 [Chloroflexaceae bacterium]